MSKRLTDTEIWKKSWFYDLEQKYKLFWFYILSDCDAAGVWSVNLKLANNILGYKLNEDELINIFNEQICVLNGGRYWLIVDFIKFQYGYPLSDTSKMRKKLDELLSLRNLNLDTLYEDINTLSIGYQYSINTVKDKDIDKDKEKDKDIKEEKDENQIKFESYIKENYPKFFQTKYPLTYPNYQKLVERFGKKLIKDKFDAMHCKADFLKKYDDPYKVALNWLKKDNPEL